MCFRVRWPHPRIQVPLSLSQAARDIQGQCHWACCSCGVLLRWCHCLDVTPISAGNRLASMREPPLGWSQRSSERWKRLGFWWHCWAVKPTTPKACPPSRLPVLSDNRFPLFFFQCSWTSFKSSWWILWINGRYGVNWGQSNSKPMLFVISPWMIRISCLFH